MKKQMLAFVILSIFSLTTAVHSHKPISIADSTNPSFNGSEFTEWSTPENLGPGINSTANDVAPAMSRDGRSLYFSSTRLGGWGGEDIWVSHRTSRTQAWGTPINLGPAINTIAMERVRYLSPDGHLLLFQSDRVDGFGGSDIWVSRRRGVNDDSGWEAPVNLGQVINTGGDEIGFDFLLGNRGSSDRVYFGSSRAGGLGSADFYASDILSDGSFGEPLNLMELSSPQHDSCLTIRNDGLEIIFTSRRPDPLDQSTSADLWVSTRASVDDVWSGPTNLGSGVNRNGFQDCCPSLSFDAKSLFFTSTRPGGLGGQDIYMTTRERRKEKE